MLGSYSVRSMVALEGLCSYYAEKRGLPVGLKSFKCCKKKTKQPILQLATLQMFFCVL